MLSIAIIFFIHSVLNIFVLVAQELHTSPEKSPDMTRIVKVRTETNLYSECVLNAL